MSTKRTITLTDRPPVTISEEHWPLIARGSDSEHDGQVECQANTESKWFIGVRQHADGRAIVYSTYWYSSNWQGARCYNPKHGVMLPAGSTPEAICAAINDVAQGMAGCECYGNDAERWPTLADECIADMPAEDLDAPVAIDNAITLILDRYDVPEDKRSAIRAVIASASPNTAAELLTRLLEPFAAPVDVSRYSVDADGHWVPKSEAAS